jgi:hypothetical protein
MEPLTSGYPHIFEELKNQMIADIEQGDQVKIITQMEGFPIEDITMLTTVEEVENWFEPYLS